MADSLGTDVLRELLRRWWLILGVTVIAGVAGYLYARSLPEYYKSTINCVPPRADNTGLTGAMGGLSSTLKDIGLTKLGGKSGETFEFIVLLYTRALRDSIIDRFKLAEEYEMVGRPKSEVRDMFFDNLEIDLHAEGNYEISVWSRDREKAVQMARAVVDQANYLANKIQREEASKSAEYLERRIVSMDSSLTDLADSLAMFGNKYMIFSPPDQAKAAAGALATAQEQVLTQETALGLLQRTYGMDDPSVRTQRQLVEELKHKFQSIQTEPGFTGNLAIRDASGVGIRYLRTYAQFEAFSRLKAFLLPTLEQTKLDMNKTSPSLLVIDDPLPAEKKDRPKRSLIALGAGFGMGLTALLLILVRFAWKRTVKPKVA